MDPDLEIPSRILVRSLYNNYTLNNNKCHFFLELRKWIIEELPLLKTSSEILYFDLSSAANPFHFAMDPDPNPT